MDGGGYTATRHKVPAQCPACSRRSTILTMVLELLLLFCSPREQSSVQRRETAERLHNVVGRVRAIGQWVSSNSGQRIQKGSPRRLGEAVSPHRWRSAGRGCCKIEPVKGELGWGPTHRC